MLHLLEGPLYGNTTERVRVRDNKRREWSTRQDSNPQPHDPERSSLPLCYSCCYNYCELSSIKHFFRFSCHQRLARWPRVSRTLTWTGVQSSTSCRAAWPDGSSTTSASQFRLSSRPSSSQPRIRLVLSCRTPSPTSRPCWTFAASSCPTESGTCRKGTSRWPSWRSWRRCRSASASTTFTG